jgi:lysine 2,3-aminomutase
MKLYTAIELKKILQGSAAGCNMPQFVIDLPNGDGKRFVSSYDSYDRETGIGTFYSPQITKRQEKLFFYFDPLSSIANRYQQFNANQFIKLMNEQLINNGNNSFSQLNSILQ